MPVNRREFFRAGLGGAVLASLAGLARAGASPLLPVQIAYAGSMAAVMNGALRQAARREGWDLHGRAQGATALAELIAGGALHPGVFLSITAAPMLRVLHAHRAARALAFARTSFTLAYNPRGRWAEQLRRQPWWRLAQQPGFRLGRSDPRTDPQGRNIIYMCLLAETFYHQPGLAHRILGSWTNPAQVFAESSLEARLQSGQLDAAAAYQFQPAAYGLAGLPLPDAINLATLSPEAQRLQLNLAGQLFHPEPLVFYAAAMTRSAHPQAAQAFLSWLLQPPAQAIFRRAGYFAPGAAPDLAGHD